MRRSTSRTQARMPKASRSTYACAPAKALPARRMLRRRRARPGRTRPGLVRPRARQFPMLCRRFGAGLAASEMLTADARLWDTPKSQRRMDHRGEASPRVVQIAGFDPTMMADGARRKVD